MKAYKFSVFAAAMSCVLTANAQLYKGDFLLNGGVNIYSTSNINPITIGEKIVFGFDINYFAADKFSLGGGFEYFNDLNKGAIALGMRYYLSETIFFRSKGYYFFNKKKNPFDLSFGLGNDFMLSDHWAIEVNADYYVQPKAVIFRFGLGVFF